MLNSRTGRCVEVAQWDAVISVSDNLEIERCTYLRLEGQPERKGAQQTDEQRKSRCNICFDLRGAIVIDKNVPSRIVVSVPGKLSTDCCSKRRVGAYQCDGDHPYNPGGNLSVKTS